MADTSYSGLGNPLAQQPWTCSFLASFCSLGLGSYSGFVCLIVCLFFLKESTSTWGICCLIIKITSPWLHLVPCKFSRAENIYRILWIGFLFSKRSPATTLETQSHAGRAQILVNASPVASHVSLFISRKFSIKEPQRHCSSQHQLQNTETFCSCLNGSQVGRRDGRSD